MIILLDFFWEVMQNRNVNCKKDAEQEGSKESLSPKGMFISEAHGEAQPAVFQEIIHVTQGEL